MVAKESMKPLLTTIHERNDICEMTEPVSGRQPVLPLLTRLLWAAALVLPVFGAKAGVVLTTLYSFTGGNDGSGPSGPVQGTDGNFYGTTAGGAHNSGTVFRLAVVPVCLHRAMEKGRRHKSTCAG